MSHIDIDLDKVIALKCIHCDCCITASIFDACYVDWVISTDKSGEISAICPVHARPISDEIQRAYSAHESQKKNTN